MCAGVSGDAFCVWLNLNVLHTCKKVTLSLCDVMTVWEGEETDEIS